MRGVKFIPLIIANVLFIISVLVIPSAAEIVPKLPGPMPSFKVLSVKEQRVNIEQEHDNQLFKVYVVNVSADGGTWTIWITQENRVLMQRFSR